MFFYGRVWKDEHPGGGDREEELVHSSDKKQQLGAARTRKMEKGEAAHSTRPRTQSKNPTHEGIAMLTIRFGIVTDEGKKNA